MTKKICFYSPGLCIRGSTVALWDYATGNEDILGGKSIIALSFYAPCDKDILNKFQNRFEIYWYMDLNHLDQILQDQRCDILYTMKYGKKDGIESKKVKTVVHCVFDLSEPHGDVYAAVSESLARKYNSSVWVPHMIGLTPSKNPKDNLRKHLGIPVDAIVIGRHGGKDTFNISWCHEAINKIVHKNPNIWFVFVNTLKNWAHQHPHIIFIDKITDEDEKNRYIQTLDAHLECSTLGHTFGLSIGECSMNGIPSMVYKSHSLWNTAHIQNLGEDGAMYFEDEESFTKLVETFEKGSWKDKKLGCFSEKFGKKQVMDKFKEIFLS